MTTHGFNPACADTPSAPRTIKFYCRCCHRTLIEPNQASYSLRSCASCQVIMEITIVEEGKVIDFGRARYAKIAGEDRKVIALPTVKEDEQPKHAGEALW